MGPVTRGSYDRMFPAETEISFKKPESCFTGQSAGSAESFRKVGKQGIDVPPPTPAASFFLCTTNIPRSA